MLILWQLARMDKFLLVVVETVQSNCGIYKMETQFSLSQDIQPRLIRSVLARMETLWLVAVMMGVSRFGGVMGEVRGKDKNYGGIGKQGTTKLDCMRNKPINA